MSLAEVTKASARGAALRPRTGDDTFDVDGDARGDAAGEAAGDARGDAKGEASGDRTNDSVELALDSVPPFNLRNALIMNQ